MDMCTMMLRYHGDGGISRAMFLVLHGASKPDDMFLPRMPPRTLRGNPTSSQTSIIRNIVVNGNAYRARH